MSPIIEAVDDGHIDHAGKCILCKTAWPCKQMRNAREANKAYVTKLQQEARDVPAFRFIA